MTIFWNQPLFFNKFKKIKLKFLYNIIFFRLIIRVVYKELSQINVSKKKISFEIIKFN